MQTTTYHNPRNAKPTVGMIYPDHAAEDDYPTAAQWLGVHLPVAHIYGTDLHAVPELLDLGRPDRLAQAASELTVHQPHAVMWACTSGSFVYGVEGAEQQAQQLSAAAGVPAASTSQAYVAALQTLGVQRVAIAASYPPEVAELFVVYLAAFDIDVVTLSSSSIHTAAEVGQLSGADVLTLAKDHDDPAAEALLIPDTAMRTVGLLQQLEAQTGKPVLTANQVTIWYGLQIAGFHRSAARLGALFTT